MIVASAEDAIHIEFVKDIVFGPVDLVAPLKFVRRDKNFISHHEVLNHDFTVSINSALVSERQT